MKRLLLLSLFVFFTHAAFGQHWQRVNTPWTHAQDTAHENFVQVPYFLNSNLGFVYTAAWRMNARRTWNLNGVTTSHIYRTTDGGSTWSPVLPFDNTDIAIQQLFFTSLSHGYIIIDSTFPSGLISGILFETNDTGNTWHRLTDEAFCPFTVYAAHDQLFAAGSAPRVYDFSFLTLGAFPYSEPGKLYRSTDSGLTWSAVSGIPGDRIAQVSGNRDSIVCVLTEDRTNNIYLNYFVDLGAHWTNYLMGQWDPGAYNYTFEMSASAFPFSCDVAAMYDGSLQFGQDVTTLYKGNLRAPSVHMSPLMTHESGSWIAGTSCAKYFSNAVEATESIDSGLIRFGELGDTVYVGGPDVMEVDDVDYPNISVVGHGAVVYVSEPWKQTLWKTTDGGNGSLSEAVLAPTFTFSQTLANADTGAVPTICSSTAWSIVERNTACSPVMPVGYSISGLDPGEYTISRTHHHICDALPDTTVIEITPVRFGMRNIQLHTSYVDDEFGSIDTTLSVQFLAKKGPPTSILASLGTSPGFHSPDTADIPVYLSCGSSTTLDDSTTIVLTVAPSAAIDRVVEFRSNIEGLKSSEISQHNGYWTIVLRGYNIAIDSQTFAGVLRCRIAITDTQQSYVSLSNSNFSSNDPRCLTLSISADSIPVRSTACGAATTIQFLNDNRISFSVQPNPANDVVVVHVAGFSNSDALGYQLLDYYGNTIMRGALTHSESTIDVHDVPSGAYYLRLQSANGCPPLGRALIIQR